MSALIVLFNLKEGVSPTAYEDWALNTDVPTVKGLASVDDFKVYQLDALMGGGGDPPFQYVEVIEINDMEGLGRDVGTDQMKKVAAEFQQFADNPIFIVSHQIA